ncbi:MAG TPA: LCP family protein [Clostridiaceae bacterium]|jgi:LCP family protein required for cell wall assembly|nr:LCP family protein [Clostridiaceae bacterium]
MRVKKFLIAGVLIITSLLFITGIRIVANIKERVLPKPESRKNINDSNIPGKHGIRNFETISDESSITSSGPVNLLLLGLDDGGERCDVVMLFNGSPSSGKVNVLSIPRDTKVYRNGRAMKFNALYGYGSEQQVIEEVKRMTDLTVDYYVTIDFAGFRKIIDTLGGVVIDVPIDMHYDDPLQNLHIHLNKGLQVLDGKKAEQFVRYRKGNNENEGYIEGDIGRIKVQQQFIKALIEQKFKLRYILKAKDIFNILKEHMKTNISVLDVAHYATMANKIELEEISTFSLPGEVVLEGNTWYVLWDRKATKDIIEENFFK